MGTGRLGGGRGGGGGGGRRAQRARTRANARREARARDSLKRLSVPAVDARARRRRSSVRAAKPAAASAHSVTGRPGRDRAVARARPRRGDALATVPPRTADAGMGTPRARTVVAIAPVGDARASAKDDSRPHRLGLSNARFSRGGSHDREPHTTASRGLGRGSPRTLRTAATAPSCRGNPATYGVRRGVCERDRAVLTKRVEKL